MASLDEITFEGVTFPAGGEGPGFRAWTTPMGDDFRLYHYALPPDLAASPARLDQLRAYYRSMVDAGGVGLVEVEICTIDHCVAVRTLIKAPQQPRGRAYIGSLTLPFRDFSYVLKVQAEERGPTGMREAVVLDRLLQSGAVELDPATNEIRGWADDPYDATNRTAMVRNRTERPEYDAMFPMHALTRARETLALFERCVRISPHVRNAAPFVYPR